ncbi:PD-(D/E)XK nuclease-like domain-containing protein [Nocardia farcinica]|uniref:PD-(D/E)XK nuclease-like domain-containing protein n=1 Tax=Nocardia farcinica TaxID=37329 RepID=UPI002453B043|nr:PD-(D/E)XK nuclease-like domain-containing protein [Nocardia farcinica]
MSDLITSPPTVPGIYPDIPIEVYHGDLASLSFSWAKKLLPPSCPAKFHAERTSQRGYVKHFNDGHAVHTRVLGEGPEIVVIDAPDWRTAAARAARDQALAEGKTPLLKHEDEMTRAMAAAVHDHPQAAALLAEGKAEQSLYWVDPETWIRLRTRPDWITEQRGRRVFVDYKTTKSAAPGIFRASAGDFGYHQQAAFNVAGAREVLDEDVRVVFIAQEKEPPYLVSVHEWSPEDLEIGAALNRLAIDIYAACMAEDYWPGYGDDIHQLRLTSKARYFAEELLR